MGRQLYESEADIARELDFKKKIEDVFSCELDKLPTEQQLDYLICRRYYDKGLKRFNSGVVALGELKCRTCASTDFPTAILSEHKAKRFFSFWDKHFLRADGNGAVAFIYFIRYADCDRYARIRTIEGLERRKLSAANHADDPTDTEWVVYVPSEDFRTF